MTCARTSVVEAAKDASLSRRHRRATELSSRSRIATVPWPPMSSFIDPPLRRAALGSKVDGSEARAAAYDPSAPYRYRAIFISDTHLGTPGCRADALLGFLRCTEPFTTAWHTQFPEYVHARCRMPLG